METTHIECISPAIETINAGDILKAVQQTVDKAFANQMTPIIDFAKNIQPYSGNILEWHLGKTDNCLDFAYRMNKDFDGPLLGVDRLNTGHNFLHNYACLSLLNHEEERFRFGIKNTWIEYDYPFQHNPALFFDVQRESLNYVEEVFQSVKQATEIFNFDLPPGLAELLQKLAVRGFKAVYYGLMYSRHSKAIRLTINNIPPDELADTLLWLGWQGNNAALKYLQQHFLSNVQKIVLAIDFDGNLGHRIGIEVFDENLNHFSKLLCDQEIISNQQAIIISEWTGKLLLDTELASALSNLHQRDTPYIYKRVNHFKFIVDDGDIISTKCYLYYCF